MSNRIIQLQNKRRIKVKEYNDTLTSSWKKKLKRIELQIIDSQISRERLKHQYA
jgi:hypothetical protein